MEINTTTRVQTSKLKVISSASRFTPGFSFINLSILRATLLIA